MKKLLETSRMLHEKCYKKNISRTYQYLRFSYDLKKIFIYPYNRYVNLVIKNKL